MTAYSCQKHDRDDRVTIPLLDGRTLMLGRPCAFVSLADSAALHKPLATTRAILSIQSNSINGLRKFKHILAHMSGRHVYRLNTRTVIARIRNLVNTHRLVALLLPPLTDSEYSADGSGLNMAPAAIKDGVEIEKIIITAKTLFEDLKTLSAKLKYVVSTVGNHILKKETAEKFAKALTTNAIVATVAVLVIWAGSHFVAGAGLAIDAVMIAVGWIFIGWGIFNLVKDMIKLFFVIKKANSLDELDAASKKLADILVQFGADVIIGLLTRGAGKLKRNADTKRKTGDAADDAPAEKPKKEAETKTKPKKQFKAGDTLHGRKITRVKDGNDDPIVLIGTKMDGDDGVIAVAEKLRAEGKNVEILEDKFLNGKKWKIDGQEWDVDSAWSDMKTGKKWAQDRLNGNGYIPNDILPETPMYKLNQAWIKSKNASGATILDIGNPTNSGSIFYKMEKSSVIWN